MKAVVQSYAEGKVTVVDMPAPILRPGGVLVRTQASVVSAGTERRMVETARKSLLGKAMDRPDLVARFMAKARKDGLLTAIEAARRRLDAPMLLGYSSAGVVLEAGEAAPGFNPGDRVACAGAGYAGHSEVAYLPKRLAVRLPDGVDFESGAFATVGAIALQGLRLAGPQLGETVAVLGLGLIGLLTAQLARAAGCRVTGMDPDPERCALAKTLGADGAFAEADAFTAEVNRLTAGLGADKVLVCAATSSSDPVRLAGEAARDRAVVVAVGDVGMDIPRKSYFEKELTFRVSRSYGPGRYDPEYEEFGRDYPAGHVRWTETRNMSAFLDLLAAGSIKALPLITHRFLIADASKAYDLLTSGAASLGIVLSYPSEEEVSRPGRIVLERAPGPGDQTAKVGLIGAGDFALSTLLPAMKADVRTRLIGVCSASGLTSRKAAEKFGFRYAGAGEADILADRDINAVVVATRHHLHSTQAAKAIDAGKHVFCEKPLALDADGLSAVVSALLKAGNGRVLTVGFNRRFAPMAQAMRAFLSERGGPLVMSYRVNAGPLPPTHWLLDPLQGGGRLLGEVCHFIDFLTFLCWSPVRRVVSRMACGHGASEGQDAAILLEHADGSVGTIQYFSTGDPAFPKERVEAFGGGAAAVLDNFRRLELSRDGRRRTGQSMLKQDKGHPAEWKAFVDAVSTGGPPPIPIEDLASVALATFAAAESGRTGRPVMVDEASFLKAAGGAGG